MENVSSLSSFAFFCVENYSSLFSFGFFLHGKRFITFLFCIFLRGKCFINALLMKRFPRKKIAPMKCFQEMMRFLWGGGRGQEDKAGALFGAEGDTRRRRTTATSSSLVAIETIAVFGSTTSRDSCRAFKRTQTSTSCRSGGHKAQSLLIPYP